MVKFERTVTGNYTYGDFTIHQSWMMFNKYFVKSSKSLDVLFTGTLKQCKNFVTNYKES